ncbi:hypothetical protein DMC01_01180 [Campylobacter troglodytis]|nr:hypothetical protein DMC01_01180 [Campylobacter troglodytis]
MKEGEFRYNVKVKNENLYKILLKWLRKILAILAKSINRLLNIAKFKAKFTKRDLAIPQSCKLTSFTVFYQR